MRLFPVGAYSERMAVMDDVIPLHTAVQASDGTLLNSITIRKGQVCIGKSAENAVTELYDLKMIYIPRLSINTRPGAWGPDGQAFVPSRWLEVEDSGNEKTSFTPPQVSVSGWNNLNTFSEGARMCLGYRLAVLEFKATIVGVSNAPKSRFLNWKPGTSSNTNSLMSAAMMALNSKTARRYPRHMRAPSLKVFRLFHPDTETCGGVNDVFSLPLSSTSSQRDGTNA